VSNQVTPRYPTDLQQEQETKKAANAVLPHIADRHGWPEDPSLGVIYPLPHSLGHLSFLRSLLRCFVVEQFVPHLFGGIDATLLELLPASGSFGIGAKPFIFPPMND
jgi:hypothetical protein